uniref:Uncharacterized protein n=1 Tax=Romanomermis culicivorax TaxID=13658 RepID=A0A915KWZ3_ROMCU
MSGQFAELISELQKVSPSEHTDEWIKKLEKQMLLKGIKQNDDAIKIVYLELHLRGDALTKFENISNSSTPPVTYAQFKAALSYWPKGYCKPKFTPNDHMAQKHDNFSAGTISPNLAGQTGMSPMKSLKTEVVFYPNTCMGTN